MRVPVVLRQLEENMNDEQASQVEEVLRAFDAAWARKDLEGVLATFAQDATLESPLVLRILKRKTGVLRGLDEIREMVSALLKRGTPWTKHSAPLIRGTMAAIEFSSADAAGEGFYSVDIIEIEGGKIQSLRAYSGWRALSAQAGATPAPS